MMQKTGKKNLQDNALVKAVSKYRNKGQVRDHIYLPTEADI